MVLSCQLSALKLIPHLEKENNGLNFCNFSQASSQNFKFSTCCFVKEHPAQNEMQVVHRVDCDNFLHAVAQPSQPDKMASKSNDSIDLKCY